MFDLKKIYEEILFLITKTISINTISYKLREFIKKLDFRENDLFFIPKEIRFSIAKEIKNPICFSNSIDLLVDFVKDKVVYFVDAKKEGRKSIVFLSYLCIFNLFIEIADLENLELELAKDDSKSILIENSGKSQDLSDFLDFFNFLKEIVNSNIDKNIFYQKYLFKTEEFYEKILTFPILKIRESEIGNPLVDIDRYKKSMYINQTSEFIDYIKKMDEKKFQKIFSSFNLFFFSNLSPFQKITNTHLELSLLLPPFFKIELKDMKGRLFSSLSFGEKLLNALLYEILSFCLEQESEDIKDITLNIVYDEFDIGMHPEMQRKFVSFAVKVAELLKEVKKEITQINWIIATHSPFILSDIPKENVIFLEKGKVVSDSWGKGENTFGANLYDLLEKGFFLESSIGQYSEELIKEVALLIEFCYAFVRLEENPFLMRKLIKEGYKELNDMKKEDKELKERLVKDFREYVEKVFQKEGLSFSRIKENFYNREKGTIPIDFEKVKSFIQIIGEPIIQQRLISMIKEIKKYENKQ